MLLNKLLASASTVPHTNPTPTTTNEQLMRFGNYAGSNDTKAMALYLANKGLINASDIYNSTPNTTSAQGITSSQADWKPAKIQGMLMQARRLGVTPQNIDANWDVVMGNDRYAAALKDKNFNVIHPNFKSIFKNILAEQYAKEKSTSYTDVAKK